MRILKYAAVILLGLLLGLYESTFQTFLVGWPSFLKPILPSLVFFMLLERRGYAIAFGVSAGIVLDLFAVEFPTFAPWRLVTIAALLWLASERLLTNRSVYSTVAMVLAARSVEWIWLGSVEALFSLIGRRAYLAPDFGSLAKIAAADLFLTVSLFFLGLFIMRRYLRPRRFMAYG
jgi:hypothetical protein